MLASTGSSRAVRSEAMSKHGRQAQGKLGLLPSPQSKFAPENLYRGMKERYGDRHHMIAPLSKGSDAGSPVSWKGPAGPFDLSPLEPGRGLAAVTWPRSCPGRPARAR